MARALTVGGDDEVQAKAVSHLLNGREGCDVQAQAGQQGVLVARALVSRVGRRGCQQFVGIPVLELHRIESRFGGGMRHGHGPPHVAVVVHTDLGDQTKVAHRPPPTRDRARSRSSGVSMSKARQGSTQTGQYGDRSRGSPRRRRATRAA